MSVSSPSGLGQRTDSASLGCFRMRSNSGMDGDEEEDGIFHPVEPRARIPMLPPVLVRRVERVGEGRMS